MPPEPNKKIETLLKGYARQRQKELPADCEIPFATRQRLQREVSRQYNSKPQPQARWSKLFWFRAALATSLCVGIAGLYLIVFHSSQSIETKTVKPSSEMAKANHLAEQLEAAPGSNAQLGLARESENLGERLGTARSTSPQNQPVTLLNSETSSKREEKIVAPKLAVIPVAAASQNSRFSAATPVILTAERFTTVDRGADKARPTTVLTTFDLQRTGPAVKIVDADGSIYAGATLAPAVASEKLGRTLQLQDSSPLETYYGFQAAGTNLTLQQRVSLTGEVLRSAVVNSGRSAGYLPAAALTSETPASLTIRATALVGATNQIQIKAVSSPAR